MDLNTGYTIPYLANNSYVNEPRPIAGNIKKQEPFIVSMSNLTSPYSEGNPIKVSVNGYVQKPNQVITNESNYFYYESPSENPKASFYEHPISRPLAPLQHQNNEPYHYQHRDRTQLQQVLPPRSGIIETSHLSIPSAQGSQQSYQPSKNFLTPSYRSSAETGTYKDYKNLSVRKDSSYANHFDSDQCSTYSKSDLTSQDQKSLMKEESYSACSKKQDVSSYFIEKYINCSDKESKALDSGNYLPYSRDKHILGENNIPHNKRENDFSTCTHSIRSGAFLDDIIEKYKDKFVDHPSKKENFVRTKQKNCENYSKEDSGPKGCNEISAVRPSREIWADQARNSKNFTVDRPTLENTKLNTSCQNLLKRKSRTVKKCKKRVGVRSATPCRDKIPSEKREIEDLAVHILKLHAKHCPNLRKEISAIKCNKLFNL